jgi:hypothetical protein
MAVLSFKDFGKVVSLSAGFPAKSEDDAYAKLKLIVFYFGVPIVIGYLLAAGRAVGPNAELLSWNIVYYPLRGLVLWLAYSLATIVFVAIFKPSKSWFIFAVIVGWAVGSPLAHFMGRLILPLAIGGRDDFFIGNISLYSLYGRPYVGLVVWIAIASFFYWVIGVPLFGFEPATPSVAPRSDGREIEVKLDKKSSPLLSRLPQNLEGDILGIMAEEHYLRVYTASGNALILYRLSDAVRELGDYGMLVHRSYWVAKAAITGNIKRGQNSILILSNGLEVPVSRGFRQKVLEAGLL